MKKQANQVQETDISGGILLATVVIVIGLVVYATNLLLQMKTSTASRASAPRTTKKAESAQDQWCKQNAPLSGDLNRKKAVDYSASGDKCATLTSLCDISANYALDKTTTFSTLALNDPNRCSVRGCCRAVSGSNYGLNAFADMHCKSNLENSEAVCIQGEAAKSTCATTYGAKAVSEIKCAVPNMYNSPLKSNTLVEGYCCNVPVSTLQTSCGRNRMNCTLFNATVATDNEKLKNTTLTGQVTNAQCIENEAHTDAYCVNNAVTSVNGKTVCDGSQFRFGVLASDDCFTTTYGEQASTTTGVPTCIYKKVPLGSGEKCSQKIKR